MLLEILKILVWPGMALIIGLVAITVFRSPLVRLIDRASSLKRGETIIELSTRPEQQQAAISIDRGGRPEGLAGPEAIPATTPESERNSTVEGSAAITEGGDGAVGEGAALEATARAAVTLTGTLTVEGHAPTATVEIDPGRLASIRNFGVSPLIVSAEEAIMRDLQGIPEAERIGVLARHLAASQVRAAVEETYRIIYGSQIAVLQHLNLFGPTRESKLEEDFYNVALAEFQDVYAKHNITPATYFSFLENTGLVVRAGNDRDCYAITMRGRGFLEWLVSQGISINKGL